MNIDEFIEKFVEAVDFQEPEEVLPNTVIKELKQWDSLAQLGVIVLLELECSKQLTAADLDRCHTIQDLYELANQ